MSATVSQLLELLWRIAPAELAEPWDNVGLLAGRSGAEVHRVLCALDLNEEVLAEAARVGAQLIVTHHPILFRGRKNLREDDAEGRLLCGLVRADIALIAMHTNFDKANPGVNDALANVLGLYDVQPIEDIARVGSVRPQSFETFAEAISQALGGSVRRYGSADREIHRVAVLGGSGGDYVDAARAAGADAFVTGEISYHRALDAVAEGICVLEAGHAATEAPGISALAEALQNASDALQYHVEVLKSQGTLWQ